MAGVLFPEGNMLPSLRLADGIARILKIAKFQISLYRCPWGSTRSATPLSRC